MPRPMMVREKATWKLAAKSAPELRPLMEMPEASMLSFGSGGKAAAATNIMHVGITEHTPTST
eukprot:6899689-Prymnesium_polylepis.1